MTEPPKTITEDSIRKFDGTLYNLSLLLLPEEDSILYAIKNGRKKENSWEKRKEFEQKIRFDPLMPDQVFRTVKRNLEYFLLNRNHVIEGL